MCDQYYMEGYNEGYSDCDCEWKRDYEKLEQQLKEAEGVIDIIANTADDIDSFDLDQSFRETAREYFDKYENGEERDERESWVDKCDWSSNQKNIIGE